MADLPESLRCRGMRDLLPEEMARFRRVEEVFATTCRQWGYQEVRTPTIEYLHLFTAAGTLSPQMLSRVYSFLDWDGWSGERVVLRPDATIPAARMYAEHFESGRVAKLFYVQNVFRFASGEESREDWQCGVELIGDTGTRGDAELALLGTEVLEALGVAEVEVVLSHAGLARAVLARAGFSPEEQGALYDRILDGDLTVLDELEGRLKRRKAPLRLLFEVQGSGSGYLANLRGSLQPAVPELAEPLEQLTLVTETLAEAGRPCRIQAALARSFEYYSGPVFSFLAGGQRVGGGGRYDELIGLVSGRSVPASGFELDVGPLSRLLPEPPEEGHAAPVVVVRAEGGTPRDLARAYASARDLRERGVRAGVALDAGEGGDWELCVGEDPPYTLRAAGSRKARRFSDLEGVLTVLEGSGR
jgi:histidyl-tRNA synthetase